MEKSNAMMECVRKAYGLKQLNVLKHDINNPWIYCVENEGKKLFLKIKSDFTANNRNVKYLEAILNCFEDENIKFPKIINTIDGRMSMNYDGYVIEIQEWMEMDAYDGSEETISSTVDLLITILTAMKKMECDTDFESVWEYINNEKFNWEKMDFLLNKYLPKEKNILEEICFFLDSCSNKYKFQIEKQSVQWTHGDFNLKNIGYEGKKATTVFDFERIKPGSPIEDIALCFFEICIKNVDFNDIENNVSSFMNKLSKYDGVNYSIGAILFVICRRMLRHIYRGVERMDKGEEVYAGFYDIFLEGLKKSYWYFSRIEKTVEKSSLSSYERELFVLLIDISKIEMEQEDLFYEWILDDKKMDVLFKFCCKHKIMSNLYYHLIHRNILNKVSKYYVILMNNTMSYNKEKKALYYREFNILNADLQERKIPYACIKGISIGKRFYEENPNILRDFNDIDFLVSIHNLSEVEKILKENGYGRGFYDYETSEFEPASRKDIVYWKTASHQVYPYTKPMPNFEYSPVNVFKVDVNFSIYFGGNIRDEISTDEMMQHLRIIEDASGSYKVLEAEYEILQYCYHFYKDTVYKFKKNGLSYVLSNLRDIHLLVEKNDLDFKKLYGLLDRTSVGNNVYRVIADAYYCYGGINAKRIIDEKKIELTDAHTDDIVRQIVRMNGR